MHFKTKRHPGYTAMRVLSGQGDKEHQSGKGRPLGVFIHWGFLWRADIVGGYVFSDIQSVWMHVSRTSGVRGWRVMFSLRF